MSKFYPPYKKEVFARSIEERKNMTFKASEEIFSLVPPFPREITLDINNRCNHKCYFCANPKIRKYDALNLELAFKLMKEAKDNGSTDLALQATGEPFMDKRLPEFIKEGKRLKYDYVYINTNGALANAERAQPVIDAGCDSIKFSINAHNRKDFKKVHGYDDFDKVIENLKWIFNYRNKNNIKMGIYVSTVKNSKTDFVAEDIEKIINENCDKFEFREISNQGGGMMELKGSENIKEGNVLGSLKKDDVMSRCVYPFNRIVINPHGFVVACTADFHRKLEIGDTTKKSLTEIWNSEEFKYLRKKHLTHNLDSLYCHKCIHNVDCETTSLLDAHVKNL
jgi:radical SAM protein with 4Fe4S-binding SPASM domain